MTLLTQPWPSVRSLLLFIPLAAFAVGEPLWAQSKSTDLRLDDVLDLVRERNPRLRALQAAAQAAAYREPRLPARRCRS